MNTLINGLFDFLAVNFDKIPLLNKAKGWRTVIGYAGMAITALLFKFNIVSFETSAALVAGFNVLKDLALNAKGRE
jgi:hypothetical protein